MSNIYRSVIESSCNESRYKKKYTQDELNEMTEDEVNDLFERDLIEDNQVQRWYDYHEDTEYLKDDFLKYELENTKPKEESVMDLSGIGYDTTGFEDVPSEEEEVVVVEEEPQVDTTVPSLESQLTLASMQAVLISNDIKHIHFHSSGRKFKDIHELGDDYYAKMSEDIDFLFELGEELGISMPNMTKASEYVSGYVPCEEVNYEYPTGISEYIRILNDHILALRGLYDMVSTDVQSDLDTIIRYWSKEVNYRLTKRLDNETV